MRRLLACVIPPLAGAVIGYVTNALAVRMLFRPLKKIKIAGVPLPFTPGVLPRERGRLAVSIGGMVERELLTPQVLAERLNRADIQEKIKAGAVHLADTRYQDVVSDFMLFLAMPGMRKLLENQGMLFVNKTILSLNVFQRFFISAAKYDTSLKEKMPEIINAYLRSLEDFLRNGSVKEKAIASLAEHIEKNLEGPYSPGEEKIASLLAALDVSGLVRRRIDSLDMLQVEKIILDVMAGKFKWINLFGALIGALIGLVQVLFSP